MIIQYEIEQFVTEILSKANTLEEGEAKEKVLDKARLLFSIQEEIRNLYDESTRWSIKWANSEVVTSRTLQDNLKLTDKVRQLEKDLETLKERIPNE